MPRLLAALLGRPRPAQAAAAGPQAADAPGWYWLQHPAVAARVNRLVSRFPDVDAYGRLAEFLADEGAALPLARCVVLGCGSGGLERDLTQRGMVGRVDAYDRSGPALAEAARLAAARGYDSIRYHDADLPAGLADAEVDAVFTHSAVDRVERLEETFAAVRRVLKPNGIFHLYEFVGPSRFQWADAQLELINDWLDTLPDRLRRTPHGRKPPLQRPPLEHMLAANPGQAVRSSEVRAVLAQFFDIAEERPFGGTLLHMGLDGIAQNFDPSSAEDSARLERLFAMEDRAITRGDLGSDFTAITARPKRETGAHRQARRPSAPAAFGAPPTRQLRLPPAPDLPALDLPALDLPGLGLAGLDLTVSKVDTMAGTDDRHYLSVGLSALAVIEQALGGAEPASILDLPCGFGRVTRVLRARFPRAAITVSDLDRPGVDFSARQFGARAAYSVKDFRALELGETYDLIWVGSLMTHLPAEATRQLLAALARHLSPGGAALVTLQGPSIVPRLRTLGYGLSLDAAAEVVEEFERTGYGYRDYVGGEEYYGVSLSNDHYGISLTGRPWMKAALAACGLRLDGYDERGWDDHHDVATARLA